MSIILTPMIKTLNIPATRSCNVSESEPCVWQLSTCKSLCQMCWARGCGGLQMYPTTPRIETGRKTSEGSTQEALN